MYYQKYDTFCCTPEIRLSCNLKKKKNKHYLQVTPEIKLKCYLNTYTHIIYNLPQIQRSKAGKLASNKTRKIIYVNLCKILDSS